MLTQLGRLSIEAEGRYAQDQELQFLEDYLESVENRISAYEKIRAQAEEIIEKVEATKRDRYPQLFLQKGRNITDICRRDMTNVLRCTVAAMLIGDLDRLREGLLVWYQTLVRSFEYTPYAQINYRLIQDVAKTYLTPEEIALIMPALQLNQTILGS